MNIIVGLLTTTIVLVLGCLIIYKYADTYTNSTHFVCPYCGSAFKLSKISFAFAFKTGVPDERIVTCPACGVRGRMPIMKD